MKIAITTDSNSGITQAQAKEWGVFVLPMPFMINEQEFFEDISLTQEQFYEKLQGDADISTSQPSPAAVMDFWDKILEEYDEIVHIPMSSGLSTSTATAIMLSDDYDGRVCVADNHRISITMGHSIKDAKDMIAAGMNAREIKDRLEATGGDSSIYIMVDTLKYLKKGGRVTATAAALGALLRIKPVLTIQGEKLDSYAKARTIKQAKQLMVAGINHDIEERWGRFDPEKMYVSIAHTQNQEAAEEWREELKEIFPGAEINIDPLSLSVSCHIGPGALALAVSKKSER